MRATIGSWVLLLALTACDGGAKKDEAKGEPASEAKGDGPVGAFSSYQAKSMAIEAKLNVKRIGDAVRMAFEEERFDPGTMTATVGNLPAAAPMTPEAGSCCKQPNGTCAPTMGSWDHEAWKALGFQPFEPHRYSYEVAVEGRKVTVRAVGDLDCDGERSTYELVGEVVDGALQFPSAPSETSPLE